MNHPIPLFICLIGASALGLASCKQKETTPAGDLKEAVNDGLDRRPNEKLKDAGEDAKDAVKDAAEDLKDAAKDATR